METWYFKGCDKRTEKGLHMNATFLGEVIIQEAQFVKFFVLTEQPYEIHVKEEPMCTYADF